VTDRAASAASAQSGSRVLTAIVSLARAADRRARMAETARAAGLEVVFFDAVDAADPARGADLAGLPAAGPWGSFAPKDKACALSHLALMRAFLDSDATHLLALEDDAYLAEDLGAWIADLGWWPPDADVVKLERWRDDRLFVALGRRSVTHRGRTLARLYSKHSGTAGFMLTRAAARKILDHGAPACPVDHLLFNPAVSDLARHLVVYQVEPSLITQGNEPPGAPGASPPAPWIDPEPKWRRELRRGLYELRAIPGLSAAILSGRARLTRLTWAPRVPVPET
jgi:glycosyl transferase family 25